MEILLAQHLYVIIHPVFFSPCHLLWFYFPWSKRGCRSRFVRNVHLRRSPMSMIVAAILQVEFIDFGFHRLYISGVRLT